MRRWVRWAFHCRFGRRCAHLVLVGPTIPPLPPEMHLMAEYTCDGCGSTYRHEL